MILFTNGCSWTWGGWTWGEGLQLHEDFQTEKRLNSLWPYHLGKLVEVEKTVNLAAGCGSNSRILRTTYDWITQQTPEDLDKTIAVIQWSEYSRYEYYVPKNSNDRYENIQDRWTKVKAGLVVSKHEPSTRFPRRTSERALERSNCRLETYTDIEGMYKHIAECDALGALFNRYNIKYYYWNMDNLIYSYPIKEKNYLLQNHIWLDNGKSNWDYERVDETDPHPSLTGHKQLAEIIYSKMKEKE
jgi:hypothetical protein